MTIDGGRIAARGYQYQYLRTLECVFNVVDDPSLAAIRIEGDPFNGDSTKIDFDVIDRNDRCRLAVQVKSKQLGTSMGAAEALRILLDLIADTDADAYHVLTNATPGFNVKALGEALCMSDDPEALGIDIQPLLAGSEKQQQRLRELSPLGLRRLSKARVLFDSRSDEELRDELRERARTYRNRFRDGFGDAAAGLLVRSLLAEILRRAADPSLAVFSASEIRSSLLVQGADLVSVLCVRDLGITVGSIPPIPDVSRTKEMARVVAALTETTHNGHPRMAALIGPSGIGKSSLAAAYVADRADMYELVMWIDAENEETLLASFRDVLTELRGPAFSDALGADSRRVRSAVHTELSRLAGRWLMVLDNMCDARAHSRWIPSMGRGDMILTSNDASARYGNAEVLTVPAMEPLEAVTLLKKRLGRTTDLSDELSGVFENLARDLEYWPLAVELAAGYVASCGIPMTSLDTYRSQLLARSLNDEASLPPSYPRTLAAVISAAFKQLDANGNSGNNASRLAHSMACASAYLAPRRLPVHLLAASSLFDPDDCVDQPGIFVDANEIAPAEAVRELLRFSVVAWDEPIPAVAENSKPTELVSIRMNSIIQWFLRRWLTHPDNQIMIRRILFHVERWLTAASKTGHLAGAVAIMSHATALMAHLESMPFRDETVALLWGNVANVYLYKGNVVKADELWRREVDFLEKATKPNEVLIAQANLSLIAVFLTTPNASSLDTQTAVSRLAKAYSYAQSIAIDYPEAAVALSVRVRDILCAPDVKVPDDPELHELIQLFLDLAIHVGPTTYSRSRDELHRANLLLSISDGAREAEQLCRNFLCRATDIEPEVEARRMLIEALAAQGRWNEAEVELSELRERFGAEILLRDSISILVHNVGLRCAGAYLLQSDGGAASLLAGVLDWPVVAEMEQGERDRGPGKMTLLRAIVELWRGHRNRASEILGSIGPDNFDPDSAEEGEGWIFLVAAARLRCETASPG